MPAASALAFPGDPARCLETLRAATALNHDKLRLGMVKLVVDGSIQGFTARLRWPGYHNSAPNGIWVTAPGELDGLVQAYHDERSCTFIPMATRPRRWRSRRWRGRARAIPAGPPAHAATLPDGGRGAVPRMASLGLCANLFANHIYYWGDAHYAQTMGPDRAERMDACATAAREGVRYAIHSDAPITPLGRCSPPGARPRERHPRAGCWASPSASGGRGAARHQLGAAYTLHMDHLVGSIEVGKHADFCVLEDDPSAPESA